jgi:hypothetical protein
LAQLQQALPLGLWPVRHWLVSGLYPALLLVQRLPL